MANTVHVIARNEMTKQSILYCLHMVEIASLSLAMTGRNACDDKRNVRNDDKGICVMIVKVFVVITRTFLLIMIVIICLTR